ncbi:MAG: hypothetical protein HYT79_11355 [Elusimicrobia bacterium]|nr:hypothetical protein [Elusimicrobiota bacterium]
MAIYCGAYRTFRNTAAKVKFFGLEAGDWAGMGAVVALCSRLFPSLIWTALVSAGLWSWLYFVKGRKPQGWTQAVALYLVSSKNLLVDLEPRPAGAVQYV